MKHPAVPHCKIAEARVLLKIKGTNFWAMQAPERSTDYDYIDSVQMRCKKAERNFCFVSVGLA